MKEEYILGIEQSSIYMQQRKISEDMNDPMDVKKIKSKVKRMKNEDANGFIHVKEPAKEEDKNKNK